MTGLRPTEISFNVLGPPVGQNAAWRIITIKGHGSLALTAVAKAYKAEIARLARLTAGPAWDREAEVSVAITLYFPNRRGDVDGPVKLALDALQGVKVKGAPERIDGCLRNDSQVTFYSCERRVDAERPRTEITVRLRRPRAVEQGALL